MHKVSHVTSALFLLAVLTACSGTGGMTPTAPSTPPATSQPSPWTLVSSGPGSGTITIRELSPSPSATLTVRECPSDTVTRPCADQWRSTIDVQVNREMTNAVLVMRFYDGATLCGLSANTRDVLPADRLVTFDFSSISLWVTNSQPCQLPRRTTRMEVELWSEWSSWTNTLMMELPGTYTFVSLASTQHRAS